MKYYYSLKTFLSLVLITVSIVASGQNESTQGSWSDPIPFGLVPVAVANLPDGKLLAWSSRFRDAGFDAADGATYTEIFDPFQGQNGRALGLQLSSNNHNMFCPGINNLANGNILVAGGGSAPKTTIYNVSTNRWETSDNMNIARGYQGNVTLPDGRAFTIGGQWSGGSSAKNAEIWTEGQGWQLLSGLPESLLFNQNDLQGNPVRPADHAWVWVAPNGKLFHAGPSEDMHWFDVNGNGSATFAGKRADDTYSITGTTIMYDIGKILKVGGALNYQQGFPAKDNSYIIDINNENNVTVVPTANRLALSRAYHNSVVLPNGEVVVTGGLSTSSVFTDVGARFQAEIWNPGTNSWRTVAGMQVPRTYHSVSILMKDGRVFVGGGGLFFGGGSQNHFDAEIFTPPYLYDSSGNLAQRPTLDAPQSAGFNQSLTVNGSADISSFSFIRMSSATHSTNNEQRRVPVTFTKDGNQYTINMPNANIMPPGYYMLFAMNGNGVPSIAETVLVGNNGGGFTPPPPPPPAVTGTNLAPQATGITVSSEYSAQYGKDKLVDGIKAQFGNGEWASLGEQNPYLELSWDRAVRISTIALYDRSLENENVNSGTLIFSDGSRLEVSDIPFDGSARYVQFQERTVTSVRFQVTNGVGPNVGISEIEVFGEFTTQAPPPPPAVTGTNLAPQATGITVSSEYSAQYGKDKLVDGIKAQFGNGEWASLGEQNPYLELSWDRAVRISTIALYDRSLENENVNSGTLIFSDGSRLEVSDIPFDGSARYVQFQERTVTSVRFQVTNGVGPNVGISEIEVFGEFTTQAPPPPANNGNNIALNKPAVQSTTDVVYGRPASLAVDGNISGDYYAQSVTHTALENNAWWRVDLGASYTINQIRIFNRTDCCSERLQGAKLYVGNSESNNPGAYTEVATLGGGTTMQDFNGLNVQGRYVFIRHARQDFLSLAEVQVYGTVASNPNPPVTNTLSPANNENNVAPQASIINVSSEFSAEFNKAKLVDGIIGSWGTGEWSSRGEQTPKLRLTWDRTVRTNSIALYDRPNLSDHILSGILKFSDGSRITIGSLNNNGSQNLINFSERNITWVELEVTRGNGPNVGLSEIEVFGQFITNSVPNAPTNEGGNESIDVRVYPNPSSGIFNIELGTVFGSTNSVSVSVFNSVNRQVYREIRGGSNLKVLRIDIQFLPPGIYNIVIQANGITTTKRIIKS